jgi:hypothetical protein
MTEKQGRKRTFGELERRKSQQAGAVTGWRARYTGPDLRRHSRNFGDKMAAEAWLNAERLLIDRDLWTPPRERERRAWLAGCPAWDHVRRVGGTIDRRQAAALVDPLPVRANAA